MVQAKNPAEPSVRLLRVGEQEVPLNVVTEILSEDAGYDLDGDMGEDSSMGEETESES